jgi:hypothetical protein
VVSQWLAVSIESLEIIAGIEEPRIVQNSDTQAGLENVCAACHVAEDAVGAFKSAAVAEFKS